MTLTPELVESPTLRSLYDPSGQYDDEVSDDVFYGRLAQIRPQAQLLGYGALHGCEIALADSIHLMVDTPAAVREGVDPVRAAEIERAITVQTEKTVDRLGRITLRNSVDGLQYADTFPGGRCDLAVLDIRELAKIAHKGVKRRNGKEYLTHTEGTASIIEDAWWQHYEFTEASYKQLRIYKMLAYVHDAPEDTVDPRDSAYLAQPTIASPLVICKTLNRREVAEAERIARGSVLLDNSRGLTGKKMQNERYIGRMLAEGGQKESLPPLVKDADVCNNSRIEPEDPTIPGVAERLIKYGGNEDRIAAHARKHYSPKLAAVIGSIPHVTKQGMDHYYNRLRPLVITPEEFNGNLRHAGLRVEPSELTF